MEYRSVVGETVTETVVEKSRFLTVAVHVEGEDEAKAFLSSVRAKHPTATHVCYGYVADKLGNEQRFSDDGEPQGTAGMPILGVVKAQKLFETAVAVVRWFGGIKLGAGGLARTYAACATEGCDRAEKRTYATGVEVILETDYPEVNAALKLLEGEIVLSREFAASAVFVAMIPERDAEAFSAKARNALNGRVKISFGKKTFYPF